MCSGIVTSEDVEAMVANARSVQFEMKKKRKDNGGKRKEGNAAVYYAPPLVQSPPWRLKSAVPPPLGIRHPGGTAVEEQNFGRNQN